MSVTTTMVKELRERTSAGIMDAKRALEEAGGDMDAAEVILRKKGMANADKKGDREAKQGLVFPVIHRGTVGVLVEVNCETDFVARNEQFATLGEGIALHIAETGPQYVSPEDVPADKRESERSIHGSDESVDVKLALLSQPYIGDGHTTVGEMVRVAIGTLGENIVVRRFERFDISGSDTPAMLFQYNHQGRVGAILELGAANAAALSNEAFTDLGRNIGQHIVGMGPRYIHPDDMPTEERDRERAVHDGDDTAVDRSLVLLAQPFVRDAKQTVAQMIEQASTTLGGPVMVRRFVRYELGESLGSDRPAEALAE